MTALGAVCTSSTTGKSQTHRWNELIESVSRLPVTDPHVMALTLTLRRMRRANQHNGILCSEPRCSVCAAEITSGYKGTEQDLVELFYRHLDEVQASIKRIRQRTRRMPQSAAA